MATKKPKKVLKKKPVTHRELSDKPPRDEVREIFRTYDRDDSGSIDIGELSRLLESLGTPPNEGELEMAFDIIDTNHNQRISWEEFSAWWRTR